MLLVDAVYIHESGGKVLLEYLIRALVEQNRSFILLLDKRFESSSLPNVNTENMFLSDAGEAARKEFYRSLDTRITNILCFANVPPPVMKNGINVFILFHNSLLLSGIFEKNGYHSIDKLKLFLKRLFINGRNRKDYEWIVQTPTMRDRLSVVMKTDAGKIHILPFFELESGESDTPRQMGTFLYVADGVAQKNHRRLFDAWDWLHRHYKLQPELHVTIPVRFSELTARIQNLNGNGCRIINHGVLDKKELQHLYARSEYLIFPSLAESFGLPLLEAVSAGCKLLTADLGYVYDVVVPDRVFDPYDASSIAAAVSECMGRKTAGTSSIVINDQVNELVQLITG